MVTNDTFDLRSITHTVDALQAIKSLAPFVVDGAQLKLRAAGAEIEALRAQKTQLEYQLDAIAHGHAVEHRDDCEICVTF